MHACNLTVSFGYPSRELTKQATAKTRSWVCQGFRVSKTVHSELVDLGVHAWAPAEKSSLIMRLHMGDLSHSIREIH